jgi:hypothetical protein
LQVTELVVKIQRYFGDRANRKHARLKYTIDDRGIDWFKGELESRLGWQLEPARPFEFTDNGVTGEATPEAEATPEDDDEATPEATPEDDEDTVTGDADPLDGFSLPSGNITFMITNDSDSERSLVIERADDDDTVTGDATPEATPEDDDDATPEATPEDDDDTATGVGVGVEELDEPVQPGESTTWEVELEPGSYVMYDPDGRDEGFEVRFMVEDRDNGLMTDDDDDAGALRAGRDGSRLRQSPASLPLKRSEVGLCALRCGASARRHELCGVG